MRTSSTGCTRPCRRAPIRVTTGCLTNVAPAPGSTVTDPNIRNDNVAFFNDVQRGYKQLAFFASVDFDLIPKVLTVTGGTRYYHFDNFEKGSVTGSFGCYEAGPAPCLASATNIDDENLRTTYKGFKSRANVTWHILPDVLAYYTWSQGFRPGAFNRSAGCYIPDVAGRQSVLLASVLHLRQSDQPRARLEDGVLRSPAAVERCGLSGKLGQCADLLLRSGRAR